MNFLAQQGIHPLLFALIVDFLTMLERDSYTMKM
ncbi:hypothetical protein F896_02389 [Acinetobacter genomosp. 15BJ]|uniref:Uncharacterized protein n=1 Tax=Acinetobacter genomosp. 15BJ TaxID=106651 RepID=R9B150_9GAMM|nr:hypothetical protein F896_02389 [Acinetobacter genomosp. 15BJ]